jgi:FemAB-related protein (PEP-CTERM system-associated)
MRIVQHEQLTTDVIAPVQVYLRRKSGEPAGSSAFPAMPEHDPRWLLVLAQGLEHRPFLLIAEDEAGAIAGCLSLVLVASRLFGRFMVSLPYLNRGGLAADSSEAAAALTDAAVGLARIHDVQFLELRHIAPAEHPRLGASRSDKVCMMLDLPSDPAQLWDTIGSKVRNQIRKGEKHEPAIRWGGRELLDDFYRVLSINMRDLGTPVYPRRLFEAMLRHFPREAELAVVDMQGKPVAASLLVHDPLRRRGLTQVPTASCLREHNASCANMWMYHQLLCRAIDRGAAVFDFGRSSIDSGTYRFKKQWGAVPHPTVWQYHLRRGELNAVRPENPRYRRRIELWQKLPVWLTRVIGPRVVRGIP